MAAVKRTIQYTNRDRARSRAVGRALARLRKAHPAEYIQFLDEELEKEGIQPARAYNTAQVAVLQQEVERLRALLSEQNVEA